VHVCLFFKSAWRNQHHRRWIVTHKQEGDPLTTGWTIRGYLFFGSSCIFWRVHVPVGRLQTLPNPLLHHRPPHEKMTLSSLQNSCWFIIILIIYTIHYNAYHHNPIWEIHKKTIQTKGTQREFEDCVNCWGKASFLDTPTHFDQMGWWKKVPALLNPSTCLTSPTVGGFNFFCFHRV